MHHPRVVHVALNTARVDLVLSRRNGITLKDLTLCVQCVNNTMREAFTDSKVKPSSMAGSVY